MKKIYIFFHGGSELLNLDERCFQTILALLEHLQLSSHFRKHFTDSLSNA